MGGLRGRGEGVSEAGTGGGGVGSVRDREVKGVIYSQKLLLFFFFFSRHIHRLEEPSRLGGAGLAAKKKPQHIGER